MASDEEIASKKARRHAQYLANKEKVLAQTHAYQAEHADEIRIQKAAYYLANKTRINTTNARYRANNPDKESARHTNYQAKNREKGRANCRRWRINHLAQETARGHERRARIAKSPLNDFTAAQWVAMQAAYDHRCAYCNKRRKGRLTIDHITPLSKGGAHTLHNIIPACSSCNSRKGTRPPPIPVQPFLLL